MAFVATFVQKQQIGKNTWEFFFKTPPTFTYSPGQYADFTLAELTDDSRGNTRTFSLTSVPTDDFISFATFFPENASPYKKQLFAMQPGQSANISESMGDMVLPRLQTQPLVFVAGGLGIASFIAPLRQCERSDLSHPVVLLWAVRDEADKIDFPVLDTFRFAYRSDCVAPHRLRVTDILKHAGSTGMVYVSGSQRFTESIVAELRAHGHPDTRLAFDYFTGYSDS